MTKKRFSGELLDIAAASQLLGCSQKTLRARVTRRLLPYRRFDSRIIFIKAELITFISQLDGCWPDEVRMNLESRR